MKLWYRDMVERLAHGESFSITDKHAAVGSTQGRIQNIAHQIRERGVDFHLSITTVYFGDYHHRADGGFILVERK